MIGIFDSGVGGMTVMRAITTLLPDLPTCYLGDLARMPYGSKSDSAIIDYSTENTQFLIEQGAKLIVVACNSASAVATQKLRDRFQVPILEVITPAVHDAIASSTRGRIGVIGTRATIRSGSYKQQIAALNPAYQTYAAACPLLVPLVEEGFTNARETKMILRRYLAPLRQRQIDALILGCTHYPLLKKLIQPRIGKRVHLVDPAESMARYLKEFLQNNPELYDSIEKTGNHRYCVTDLTDSTQATANSIFQRPIEFIRL